MKILVVGDIYTETQYFVDHIPMADEFVIAESATSSVGSKTINAARVLVKLKNTVSFYSHVGDDVEGDTAISQLSAFGINAQLKKTPNEITGKITVLTSAKGKSSVTLYRGANQSIYEQHMLDLEKLIQTQDAVYAATNLYLPALYQLVLLCHKHHKPLFLDIPNQHRDIDLKKLIEVSFFAPNRQETQLLLGTKINSIDDALAAAIRLRQQLPATIIITLDKDGCVVLEKDSNQPVHHAAQKVAAVDETAAGDIFRAVLFSTWLQTKNLANSIQKALNIASNSTLIKGVNNTIDADIYH